MTSSLFALLIAKLSLHELRASVGVVADFLVRMGLLEVDSANALGVLLVGDGVFGVAWFNMSVLCWLDSHRWISDIPLGVATAGRCVFEPPCAAYLSPTFLTP
jgi:hypothetical protein